MQLPGRHRGTGCSGTTSALHAEGPGFNPQCVHPLPFATPTQEPRGQRTDKHVTRPLRSRLRSSRHASLAQLAEHALRKRMVMGSISIGGSLLATSKVAGARTHDHKVKSLALCQLSQAGGCERVLRPAILRMEICDYLLVLTHDIERFVV